MLSKIISVLLLLIMSISGTSHSVDYHSNKEASGVDTKMDLMKKFEEIAKTSVKVDFETVNNQELPIGASKFGGKPDLPKGFEWYYFTGENYDGITEKRPLSFLAQINCEEIRKYDKDNLLPEKGIIYFFYELSTMTWGFDPKDKGSARVYYFSGNLSELTRTNFPIEMETEFKLPEMKIVFSEKYDLPGYEEFSELYNYNDWDVYDEERVLSGYELEDSISKLLGYADIIQNSMLLECEKVTNGIYCGGGTDVEPEKLKEFKENSEQWQLLFQLDTVTKDNFELMFGDCGRIYFYIKKEDLKKCNFDNCWLILQCS